MVLASVSVCVRKGNLSVICIEKTRVAYEIKMLRKELGAKRLLEGRNKQVKSSGSVSNRQKHVKGSKLASIGGSKRHRLKKTKRYVAEGSSRNDIKHLNKKDNAITVLKREQRVGVKKAPAPVVVLPVVKESSSENTKIPHNLKGKKKQVKSSNRQKHLKGSKLASIGRSKRHRLKKTKRYFAEGSSRRDIKHLNKKDNAITVLKREKKVKVKKAPAPVVALPVIKESSEDTKIPHNLNFESVKTSISAMLKLVAKRSKSKNIPLFMDEAQPVHMIVQCIRIPSMKPEVYRKNFRFCLPHPLVNQFSEVCLFVPNLKKGKRIDHEETIQHYQAIIEEHKVEGISQIIPLRQVQVEYDQFELKERLISQFDTFLADGRITGHIQGLLGKKIIKRRKLPIPVDMRAKDLKKEVNTALSKTLLMVNGHGDKSSVKIGHTKQTLEQMAENIMAIAENLADKFPGGWRNIRSLKVHLQDTSPVPVYISLKSCNEVEIPVVTPPLPKKAVPVEGELSTIPGVEVTVMPGGDVIVRRKKLTEEDKAMGMTESDLEDLDFIDEEMDVENSDEETVNKEEIEIVPRTPVRDYESDSGNSHVSSTYGDETVAENAENVYLNRWHEEWNANIEENEKMKRKMEGAQENAKSGIESKKKKRKIKNNTMKEEKSADNKEMKNKKIKQENIVLRIHPQKEKPRIKNDIAGMKKRELVTGMKKGKLVPGMKRGELVTSSKEVENKKTTKEDAELKIQPPKKKPRVKSEVKKRGKSGVGSEAVENKMIAKDSAKLKIGSQKKKSEKNVMKKEKVAEGRKKLENGKLTNGQKSKKKIISGKLARHSFK